MGDQWNGRCVCANWGTNGIGDQWDGGPLGLAEIEWMNEKGDQYVVEDLWIGGPMRRGPMSGGTNEMGHQWVGGTNEMGDQWNGWCMSANWGTNEMGDWWVGGPMRWGTNEMGDQWDGGPLGLADDGVTNEKGDQWDGGPVRWGTNEMGDQWAPIMYWGTNELGDQWEGDQWDGGPMRWGTSERIPAYALQFLLALCVGNSSVTGEFPSQRPDAELCCSLWCNWANSWVNNLDAGDFRHHCAHYDVTIMFAVNCYFGDITNKSISKWCLLIACGARHL